MSVTGEKTSSHAAGMGPRSGEEAVTRLGRNNVTIQITMPVTRPATAPDAVARFQTRPPISAGAIWAMAAKEIMPMEDRLMSST